MKITYLPKVLLIKSLLERHSGVLTEVIREGFRESEPGIYAAAGWCELAKLSVEKHIQAIATGLEQNRSGPIVHAIVRVDADDSAYSEKDLTWSVTWRQSTAYGELIAAVRSCVRNDRLVANQELFQSELTQRSVK